jgi:UDP-N-acetylmuramoyl-tripeptide--D-alanyl-D-alanine ligase
MQVSTRDDGVTIINDAYNANPDSMRAGLKALAWMGRQAPRDSRSWAVLGEMAELGDDAISEHDRIGRLAVRLDVSRLIVGVRGHRGRRRQRRTRPASGRAPGR